MSSIRFPAIISYFLVIATYARIGLVIPNTYESHQLVCPEGSVFPCVIPGAFTETNQFDLANHRFYEGYINCTAAKVSITTSGLATTNAALTTQLMIDIYRDDEDPIDFLITYGIAGGMDDRLNMGDVVVASKWSLYNLWSWQSEESGVDDELPLEQFGDYTRSYGYWSTSLYHNVWFQPQELYNETAESRVHTMFFYADTDAVDLMVEIADDIEQLLDYCIVQTDGSTECLPHRPQILTDVDGEACIGLTADIFVDNFAWRQTLFDQYGAQSIDMETAAVAMVAETNNIPFVAFRSLSDLAGAQAVNTTNIIDIFFHVAVHNSITVLKEWIYYAYCDGYVEPTIPQTTEDKSGSVKYSLYSIMWVMWVMCVMKN